MSATGFGSSGYGEGAGWGAGTASSGANSANGGMSGANSIAGMLGLSGIGLSNGSDINAGRPGYDDALASVVGVSHPTLGRPDANAVALNPSASVTNGNGTLTAQAAPDYAGPTRSFLGIDYDNGSYDNRGTLSKSLDWAGKFGLKTLGSMLAGNAGSLVGGALFGLPGAFLGNLVAGQLASSSIADALNTAGDTWGAGGESNSYGHGNGGDNGYLASIGISPSRNKNTQLQNNLNYNPSLGFFDFTSGGNSGSSGGYSFSPFSSNKQDPTYLVNQQAPTQLESLGKNTTYTSF